MPDLTRAEMRCLPLGFLDAQARARPAAPVVVQALRQALHAALRPRAIALQGTEGEHNSRR